MNRKQALEEMRKEWEEIKQEFKEIGSMISSGESIDGEENE